MMVPQTPQISRKCHPLSLLLGNDGLMFCFTWQHFSQEAGLDCPVIVLRSSDLTIIAPVVPLLGNDGLMYCFTWQQFSQKAGA